MDTTCSLKRCPFCGSGFTGGIQLDCDGIANKISICIYCLGTGCLSSDKKFLALREQLISLDDLPPEKSNLAKIDLANKALRIARSTIQQLHDLAA